MTGPVGVEELTALVIQTLIGLQRNDISGTSQKRKGKNEAWKDLIEQVVRDVVG